MKRRALLLGEKSKMTMNKGDRSDSSIVSKKRKRSPATTKGKKNLFDAIPVDIIREILLRLSAADVVKIRLVCKQFTQLSWHPSFISEHTKRHNIDESTCFILNIKRTPSSRTLRCLSKLPALGKMKSLIVLNDLDPQLTTSQINYYKRRKTWFIFPKNLGRYVRNLVAACQGLLCFEAVHVVSDYKDFEKEAPFVIGNPLTGEWMSVIIPKITKTKTKILGTRVFGFYFHASSEKYKFLVMFEYMSSEGASMAYGIFELVSNILTPINQLMPYNPAINRSLAGHGPVLLHGNLHWFGYQGLTYMISGPELRVRHIVVFNTETEQFTHKQIPDGFSMAIDIQLFVFKGKLCLFKQIRWPEVFVWVLEDYESSVWIEKKAVIRRGLFDQENTYEFILYTRCLCLLLVKPDSCDPELTFYHKEISDGGDFQRQYYEHVSMRFGQKYNETIASVGMQKIMLRKPLYLH